MISLRKISCVGRDGTARYYSSIDHKYKVGEFIKTILDERKGEWGKIIIKNNKEKNGWKM